MTWPSLHRHTPADDLTTAAAIKTARADREQAAGHRVTALRLRAEAARNLRAAAGGR